jgi:hypothetical protein
LVADPVAILRADFCSDVGADAAKGLAPKVPLRIGVATPLSKLDAPGGYQHTRSA